MSDMPKFISSGTIFPFIPFNKGFRTFVKSKKNVNEEGGVWWVSTFCCHDILDRTFCCHGILDKMVCQSSLLTIIFQIYASYLDLGFTLAKS